MGSAGPASGVGLGRSGAHTAPAVVPPAQANERQREQENDHRLSEDAVRFGVRAGGGKKKKAKQVRTRP